MIWPNTWNWWSRILEKPPGFDPPIVHGESSTLRALGFSPKTEALMGGVGYGWLPRHLAEHHMERGDLVEIPFEEGSRHRFEPHLVYRKDPALGPAGRLFMELLLDACGADV